MDGRPKVETKTTVTKTVDMTLEEPEICKALEAYLRRVYPEFRGMDMQFSFHGIYADFVFSNVLVKATRIRES